ncbi:MAG: ribulokinase [Opitutaceae bacterium]
MKLKNQDMTGKFVIGIDYGTDSVRSVVVNTADGAIAGTSVFEFPRWKKGLFCNPAINQFRQHPLDYIEGLEQSVKGALLGLSPEVVRNIVGITVDTTGSTPVAVDSNGIPLSLKPGFENNPDAMFVLWKDHTAIKEADEINQSCRTWGGTDFTKYSGGIYSSEWFWAKVLHIVRKDERIEKASYSWMEHCDWLPAMLTGNTDPLVLERSRCAAGHKALWHTEWGGYPPENFLSKLDNKLTKVRRHLNDETITSDVPLGVLSEEWASRLGLHKSVVVGSGAFDAHIGAVGGEIKPYYLSKVIGTSTCDMLVIPTEDMKGILVRGICGKVDGSIIPGMEGMEAGQSAFGDIYAWFKNLLMWPIENILATSDIVDADTREKLIEEISSKIIVKLTAEAQKIPLAESGIIALDWMNGRRTPDANQALKGTISGLNLGSDAPCIFKALVEATAFGSKAIVDRFISEGVRIDGVVALGGVAKKSPFVMQILADVLNKPIKVVSSEQTCALGAAMYAAVVAGIYPTVNDAQQKMGQGYDKIYFPIVPNVKVYQSLYNQYSLLGNLIEMNKI